MPAARNGMMFSDVVNGVVGNSRSIISCAFRCLPAAVA